jgi:integrase
MVLARISLSQLEGNESKAQVEVEPDVSTLLGHRSIKITEKHYSPWDKSRRNALDSVLANVEISIPA